MSGFLGLLTATEAFVPAGQAEYTSPGTYTFIAPLGITSVSVVAVGGG